MTGPLTRPIVAFVKAMSSAVELRPYCGAMHSYPSACRATISLLKQAPSAQSQWQKTMLGFVSVDFIFRSPLVSNILVLIELDNSEHVAVNSRLLGACSFAEFC